MLFYFNAFHKSLRLIKTWCKVIRYLKKVVSKQGANKTVAGMSILKTRVKHTCLENKP